MKPTWMKRWLPVLLLALFADASPAAARKPEAELIALLRSPDPQKVLDALDRLPDWYPHSTNAIHEIKALLKSKHPATRDFPANVINRKAARALGDYHATLDGDELAIIFNFLRSPVIEEVMDGLKALRGLNEPPDLRRKISNQLLPLLKDRETHVVRDACRTLAVQGDKDVIPALEPLLRHDRRDVRKDAKEAIEALRAKS
jgi:hypothetical protein